VDTGQVGVVQRGERFRLALEALQANGVLGKMLGQLLDRHIAVQPRVAGEMHDTHAAAADFPDDLVGADLVLHWKPSTFCQARCTSGLLQGNERALYEGHVDEAIPEFR